jgi:hypothetical protein
MAIDINDVPVLTTQSPVKESEITYAANLAEGDPMANWEQAKQEIAITGDSALVRNEQVKWDEEQMASNKKAMESILLDPSVPVEQRQAVMNNYVNDITGGMKDLRTKFMIESAIRDVSVTEEDREAQTETVDTVEQRDEASLGTFKMEHVEKGYGLLKEALSFSSDTTLGGAKSLATIGSGLALSIPAGLIGGLSLLFEQDTAKATEIMNIIQGYAYSPEGTSKSDEASRIITEKITSAMEAIDAPFKWAGDQIININSIGGSEKDDLAKLFGVSTAGGSAAGATFTYLATQGIAGGVVQGAVRKAARRIEGKASVKPGSVIATIETASKEQAGNAAAKAIVDPTGKITSTLGADKASLLNTYVLPKIKDEFGDIHPDARVALEAMDKRMADLRTEVEFNPNVYPVSQILAEREAYMQILTEVEKPHLLLSSSVLDIPAEAKLFGRAGKDYEALVDSGTKSLEGTAVFGRNANHGYSTKEQAENYMDTLKFRSQHLSEPGNYSILEKDNQFYVKWDFKREYKPLDHMVFGADSISAHAFSKNRDITEFANGTIGQHLLPSFMRMKKEIPAMGSAASRKESKIETIFLDEIRNNVMKTSNPKELVSSIEKGASEGKVWTAAEVQMQHPHLTKAQTDKLYGEYAAFRRVADHMYAFADLDYRTNNLAPRNMKSLYDEKGNFVTHTTEPLTEIPEGVNEVWDLAAKKMVPLNKDLPLVKLSAEIKSGTHRAEYAHLPLDWQNGPLRAGALPKPVGYVPRGYKERFVVELIPNEAFVNGHKVPKADLPKHKEVLGMARTTFERDELVAKLQKEHPDFAVEWRREEKDINKTIINDSHVYTSFTGAAQRRGEIVPSLNRAAEIEDPIVAMTKAIRGVARRTAWGDLTDVRVSQFVKAYGEFTGHRFPDSVSDIRPLESRLMTPAKERAFLAAQSVYNQMELEQVASVMSDRVWKSGMNRLANGFEGMHMDAHVLRDWGDKGFFLPRTLKAVGSHLYLFTSPVRMWIMQPIQMMELALMSPSNAKRLLTDLPAVYSTVAAQRGILSPMKGAFMGMGKKTTPDLERIVAAIDEAGIPQEIDMNQMVHGIWNDAAKPLVNKDNSVLGGVESLRSTITKGVAIPGKIGRSIGYDKAELLNQTALWLVSRERWMAKNPKKNWDTPENRAEIARDQWVLGHGASTRAGMFKWQDGWASTVLQFAAIPFKSTLQMMSSPIFSGPEKAKLVAARLALYGVAGMPLAREIRSIFEKNMEDKEDRETLDNWTNGTVNLFVNEMILSMFDKPEEDSSVDTRNISTSMEVGGTYLYDTVAELVGILDGQPAEFELPDVVYAQAVGSVFDTARTMADILAINKKGPADLETWKAVAWKATSFTSLGSDFMKSQLLESMSKQGNAMGYQQTRGEAIARLFKFPPTEEQLMHMTVKTQIERSKHVKEDAKQIHERLIAVGKAQSADEKQQAKDYYDGLTSMLSTTTPEYKNELTTAILALDKYSWRTKKESVMMNFQKLSQDKHDAYYIEMRNTLEKSSDPEIQAMLRDFEELDKRSKK